MPPWASGGHKDVLFVFDQAGAWTRYRCDHQAEALHLAGFSCDLVRTGSVDLLGAVGHYSCFVLNRVEWTEELGAFLEDAVANECALLFDTDDLVFEPDLIDRFAIFEGWEEPELLLEVAKLERYRRTLEACGAATVTTEPLRQHARRHCGEVCVVPNAVSEQMVRLADEARAAEPHYADGATVTLAYLSGTRTHGRDFLEAADAILWALDEYPHVRFQAVGKLQLDERFDRFPGRVDRIPIQPWQALPEILTRVDVNLAPLERENPITECKSCVKYLEAALVGVPTVASARPDFVRVVDHGVNGLLADGADEWRDALGLLVESHSVRRELGECARERTLRSETTSARAPHSAETLRRFLPALTGEGSGS